MSLSKEFAEITNIENQQLEIEPQPREQAIIGRVFSDTFRSKIMYLLSGTVLLAAWWLVYDNLLSFSRLITYHVLPLQRRHASWVHGGVLHL